MLKEYKTMKKDAEKLRGDCNADHWGRVYGDLTVADVLALLEDENDHSACAVMRAIVTGDYGATLEACNILIQHDKAGYLTPELYKRRMELEKRLDA